MNTPQLNDSTDGQKSGFTVLGGLSLGIIGLETSLVAGAVGAVIGTFIGNQIDQRR